MSEWTKTTLEEVDAILQQRYRGTLASVEEKRDETGKLSETIWSNRNAAHTLEVRNTFAYELWYRELPIEENE